MKGELILTLNDGTIHRGIVEFQSDLGISDASKVGAHTIPTGVDLDFTLPIRAFMSRYAGDLSGPKKLVLFVAYFAKGEMDVAVSRGEVLDQWNKMAGLLGTKYNDAHPTRARDAGWLYSPENGKFALRNGWKDALL